MGFLTWLACSPIDGILDKLGGGDDPAPDAPTAPTPSTPSTPTAPSCSVDSASVPVLGDDPDGTYLLGSGPSLAPDGRVTVELLRVDSEGDVLGRSLVRVWPDGTRDAGFGIDGHVAEPPDASGVRWADDGFWLQRGTRLEKRTADADLDTAFGQLGVSADLETAVLRGLDADGDPLLVVGDDLLRLDADGVPDPVATLNEHPTGALGLDSGRILVTLGPDMVLLEPDGSTVALPEPIATALITAAAPDGGFWLVRGDQAVEHYDADGGLVGWFALSSDTPDPWAGSLAVAPDGSVWVGGVGYADDGAPEGVAWHLDEDGVADPCAGAGGRVPLDGMYAGYTVSAPQADGTVAFGNTEETFGAVVAWVTPWP